MRTAGFAAYTLRGLHEWKEGLAGSDIIHWNNGLWDTCDLFGDGAFTPLDTYVETMVRIARLLKRITPNIIFATTTPPSPKMWATIRTAYVSITRPSVRS